MTVPSQRRYARQIQLPEVGELGQKRILAEKLHAPGLDAQALSYAKRFGQAAGLCDALDTAPHEPADSRLKGAFRHDASRAVGLGAEAALYSVLKAIFPPSEN